MKKQQKRNIKSSKQVILRQKRKKRRRIRAAILIVELILVAVLGTAAYSMFKLDKMNMTVLDNIENNGVKREGYTNVALFGTDNRLGETTGVRSDCIIVASIDNNTKEVKLVSVYRDTLLMQADGYFNKANSAYANGGPEEAINMLNRNLDLDIEDYATVNFMSLAEVVDLLGGIDVELTVAEIENMNKYIPETGRIAGKEAHLIDVAEGTYHLDGVQAVTYCRIRSTEGGDFKRAERQRIMIGLIVDKAKEASLSTLNQIIDAVLPEVSTSFTASELMKLAAGILEYSIVGTESFPFDYEASGSVPGYTGWYNVPLGLSNNAVKLHQFLFPNEDYTPTEALQGISDELIEVTGFYPIEETEDVSEEVSEEYDSEGTYE